jgi:alanine racemase
MTHLACADHGGRAFTSAQLSKFAELWRHCPGEISIANSAAILQWPEATVRFPIPGVLNWVRPGLMLYGVSPLPGRSADSIGLCPAMSFESRLI